MAVPNAAKGKAIDYIADIINQYNSSREQQESIKFIHSNSSLSLALMGKTAIVTHPKASQIVMIPYAILPLGKFRKRYGIYPLFQNSNPLKNKDLPHARYFLHGCNVDGAGIDRCYQMIKKANYLSKTAELHKVILHTISQMKPTNYIRSLKKLLMLMTNMMIVDKDGSKYAEYYIGLLNNERSMLERNGIKPRLYFDKYFLRIEYILQSKIGPIHADDHLRNEIVNQYPILFCSTYNAALPLENELYTQELELDSVKIFFTPSKNVEQLKTRLAEIGRSKECLVYGVSASDVEEATAILDEQTSAFSHAKVLPDLTSLSESNPKILQNKKIVQNKFMESLFAYLEGKELDNFLIAMWLLKKADTAIVIDIYKEISERLEFVLHESLHTKGALNKPYLDLVGNILTADYVSRLRDLGYLKAIFHLRQNVADYLTLMDYENHLSFQQLDRLLQPASKNHKEALSTYLGRLQDYFVILSRDAALYQKNLEHISKRIAFVQTKFLDLIEECEKNNYLCLETINSDLYASIRKTLPETKKRWFVDLFNTLKHHHDESV